MNVPCVTLVSQCVPANLLPLLVCSIASPQPLHVEDMSTYHQNTPPPRREMPILLRSKYTQYIVVLMQIFPILSPFNRIPPRSIGASVGISKGAFDGQGGVEGGVRVLAVHVGVGVFVVDFFGGLFGGGSGFVGGCWVGLDGVGAVESCICADGNGAEGAGLGESPYGAVERGHGGGGRGDLNCVTRLQWVDCAVVRYRA